MFLKTERKTRKGQAMVEYALLVCCVAVVGAVATSMLGHKTADTLAVAASLMPGAHLDDNNPINTQQLVPTAIDANGVVSINTPALLTPDRFQSVLGSGGAAMLVE